MHINQYKFQLFINVLVSVWNKISNYVVIEFYNKYIGDWQSSYSLVIRLMRYLGLKAMVLFWRALLQESL